MSQRVLAPPATPEPPRLPFARPVTGNVAGNLTIVGRAIKPDTATGTTLAGWTRATNGAGGTGTTGLDVGHTRIVTDWQELVGGETGSVTFAQGTSPNSVASCMITYSQDRVVLGG